MKFNIKHTFVAAVAILSLASCSEGQYWTEPTNKGQVIAFVKPAENVTVAATENLESYTVTAYRSQTAGDLEVPVTFSNDSTVFSAPSSINFKNGENSADFVITLAPLVPGVTYSTTVGVKVPEGTITHPDSRNLSFTLTITKTLSWASLGNGTYFDGFVMDGAEAPYSVEIQKVEGMERYRAVNPYKEYYTTIGQDMYDAGWIASTGPQYVEFWENEDGSLSFKSFATGLNYDGVDGQGIGAYSWSAFAAGSGFTGDYDMWYEPGLAVLSPVYYIPNVGSFGQKQFAIRIELPK
ncbi:MAG: hypothetical protein K2H22_07510 [Muribaculaceae bacterium]|nr:hypothetical protein [Muribaculaceae bacterium]